MEKRLRPPERRFFCARVSSWQRFDPDEERYLVPAAATARALLTALAANGFKQSNDITARRSERLFHTVADHRHLAQECRSILWQDGVD